MFLFATLGTLAALFRREKAFLPLALFPVLYAAYYVFCVPVISPWYTAVFAAMAVFACARGIQASTALLPQGKPRTYTVSVAVLLYLLLFLAVLPRNFYTERQIQRIVEARGREAAGRYLAGHMGPNETLATETLGYAGYYSHAYIYDWPGTWQSASR